MHAVKESRYKYRFVVFDAVICVVYENDVILIDCEYSCFLLVSSNFLIFKNSH